MHSSQKRKKFLRGTAFILLLFALCSPLLRRVYHLVTLPMNAVRTGNMLQVGDTWYDAADYTYFAEETPIAGGMAVTKDIPAGDSSPTEVQSLLSDSWTDLQVMRLAEDPTETFVVVRSFTDYWTYVRRGYEIPEDGRVTVVYLGAVRTENTAVCEAIDAIRALDLSETVTITTDNLYRDTKALAVGYDGCPVGTDSLGRLMKTEDGSYVCIPHAAVENTGGTRQYTAIPIPDTLTAALDDSGAFSEPGFFERFLFDGMGVIRLQRMFYLVVFGIVSAAVIYALFKRKETEIS